MSKLLEEKKNDLITRAEEVLNTAKAEKRELTEAEAAELAEIKADVERIKQTLMLDDDFAKILQAEKETPKVQENSSELRLCAFRRKEYFVFY